MEYLIFWLVKEWLGRFAEKKNLTLRLCTSRNYGLLFKTGATSTGPPKWFSKFALKLLPRHDLWILLVPSVATFDSSDREQPSIEMLNQLEAYRSFVSTRKNYVIVDALAERTAKKLNQLTCNLEKS
jgi:hypothetical protein